MPISPTKPAGHGRRTTTITPAAGGVAASHLPGLDLIPAAAMGIGAMATVMLTLPLTSTMLATLLLGADGLQVMPVVIVAVVVAYVVTARITPAPPAES